MPSNKTLHMVAFILLIAGGLNWLAYGIGYDLVSMTLGSLADWVYILIGIAAIYEIATHKQNCKHCSNM